MAITPKLSAYLQEQLTIVMGKPVSIKYIALVGGGSINDAYCLSTSMGKYMVKVNDKTAYPNMFNLEAKGLNTIKVSQTVSTPDVVYCGDFENESFLVLEWIETSKGDSQALSLLGQQVAAMHRHTASSFGLEYDNYMGSLPQYNRQHDTWNSFFIEERLKPMVQMAQGKHLLSISDLAIFDKLYLRLPYLFEEEEPSLLHGDLWSGNYLICVQGKPYLIDPAVSYGHREFDIAMTRLFGGYSSDFYKAYNEAFPLTEDWQHRLDLWNLYPLLLHLNLFGKGYLGQVKAAIKKYL